MKITGADALLRALNDRTTLKDVQDVVKLNGSELDRRMTRNANFKRGYQTGTTKRSIRMDLEDGGFTAKVGPTTQYSPYLELGTRFMDAQPFVRPSLYEQKNKFISDLKRLMK